VRLWNGLDGPRRRRLGVRGGQPALDGVQHEAEIVVERAQTSCVILDRLSRTGQERSDVRCRRLGVRLAHP
jgi:hypothetical protein